MFRPLAPSHRRPQRRGTSILLIAMIMLALFSAVGTAYVFFAIREARMAQARKDEQSNITGPAAPNPTDTVNRFLGSLIFDVGDYNPGSPNLNDTDPTVLLNGVRGHSIGRAFYSRDVTAHSSALGLAYNTPGTQSLTTPWTGVGLFHEDPSTYGPYNLTGDRAQFVNYTLMMQNGNALLLDPEYMNVRPGLTAAALAPFDGARPYVGKNAGYTYPDRNNFFLAALDPATGQVMLPSFHRPALFGSLDPTNGGAASNNWTNAQGRLLTLRPRPAEHPLFPRVPPDADGVYRGDVQNWPGGYLYKNGQFVALNDSLWMNLGLPVVQFGNKKVQPLVAPLIIPVDGLFNASAHGNTYGGGHTSYAGYGPWEVNLGYLLGADAATVVNGRGTLEQRVALTNPLLGTTRAYAPYSPNQPLPTYAPVAWTNAGVTFSYVSSPNSITGVPAFNGFQNNNVPAAPHPSLFNPTEWPSLPPNGSIPDRTYPTSDLKRLQRFGFTPGWYDQADLTSPSYNYTPNSLQVSPGFRSQVPATSTSFNVAPGQTTNPAAYAYRLDPAHLRRAVITPRGYGLDRPKLVPNFPNRDGANALSFNTNPNAPNKPGFVSPAPYPSPQALGTNTDFTSQTRWSNVMAVLGSVNLNRPLADYRNLNAAPNLPTPQPLSAANVANAVQATADRQQLAYDIFTRLIAALGAGATVNTTTGQYTIQAAPGTQQYDALRYLAQLSVNIVDYIDSDDVSTAFNWNANEIVYGVEKPRLVINEAYSEIVNDPTDPVTSTAVPPAGPAKPLQVRFWLELLNPSQTQTTVPTPGPLGDGSVALNAYQIQIRRETRTAVLPMGVAADTGGFGNNQYTSLFVYTGVANTGNATNTTGSFTSPADATFTLRGVAATVSPNLPLPPALPANSYSPPPAALPANGFVLVGPPAAAKQGAEEFAPAAGVWVNEVQSGPLGNATQSAGMGYTIDLQPTNAPYSNQEFKRHIVLLRRLANPYLEFNAATNPYITVDLMDYVPSFDAVHRGANDLKDRGARTAANPGGYDPINDAAPGNNRFSVGKVQPYAGHAMTTAVPNSNPGSYNQYSFNGNGNPLLSSMVLAQNPTNAPAANTPRSTFGRHNGINAAQPGATTFTPGAAPTLSDTIMLPYDWLVHMDRPLVNQIELFQTRDTPPYRVTDLFITANNTLTASNGSIPGVSYGQGIARWRFVDDGLARALEFLTVKPYTAGVPHGGRVPGQINLNVAQDPRVIQGLFDPQAGNLFDGTFVNNTVWGQWMLSRTPTMVQFFQPNGTADTLMRPMPSLSKFDDFTLGTDIPFLPFGAPAVTAGGTFAYGGGQAGTDLTILRRPNATGRPALYANMSSRSSNPPVYTGSLPDGPTYTQSEPVRKILNNSTTVSHTYLVFLTIGYFDADVVNQLPVGGGMSIPRLGAEAFISVPGDMRQKFVAVIDMSNMALAPMTNTIAGVQPFFTSVEQTAYAGATTLNIVDTGLPGGTVAADGFATPNIFVGQQLVVGYGVEQQIVTVQGVAAGQLTVSPLTRTAWAGTCVSNVRPGYPGPQPNFDYNNTQQYGPVVPYVERLR